MRLRLRATAVAAAVGAATFGWLGNAQLVEASTIQGIDVSIWQGSARNTSIDWQAVAASGVTFTYVRAGEGSGLIDADFRSNWFHATAAGVIPGAYLYFHPADDPNAQAQLLLQMLQVVGFSAGDLVPTIDVETTDGLQPAQVVSSLQATATAIAGGLGVYPSIYTSPAWWDANVQSSAFVSQPLWVANWGVSSPSLPAQSWGGNGARVWQYTNNGSVPGISGRVDLDQASAGGLPYFGGARGHPPATPNPPAAAASASGRQYVVWKGTDNNLWDAEWNGSGWTGPSSRLMGPLGSPPTITVRSSGEVDAFWRGTDGNLWEAITSAGQWTGPYNRGMGPLGSAPTATSWGNEVDVFWRGTDQSLWEGFQVGGAWSGPHKLGMGPLGSQPAAAAHTSNGEQDVFWSGTDSQLWEAEWNGSRWIGPMGLGLRPTGTLPSVSVLPNDEEDIVWCGVDGGVVIATWKGNGWTPPQQVGMQPIGSDPTVAGWGSELDVFWQGTEHNLWEANRSHSNPWAGPQGLGMGPLG